MSAQPSYADRTARRRMSTTEFTAAAPDADRGRMASVHRCASCQGWVTLAVEYEVFPFGPEPVRVWGDDVPCRTCGAVVTIEEHRATLAAAARGFVADFWA